MASPYEFTYDQMKQAMISAYGSWETAIGYANLYGIDLNDPANLANAFENLYGGQVFRQQDGTWAIPQYKQQIRTTVQTNPANSNTAITKVSEVNPAMNVEVDPQTNKAKFSLNPKSGSFAQDAMYFAAEVGNAVSAASVGIFLGKTIDSTLYNLNPDFWDAAGMSSLDPNTWGSITAGDDSLGSSLFNFIFGIDPNSGNVQPYMDADAAAYLAWWMAEQGIFAPSETTGTVSTDAEYFPSALTSGFIFGSVGTPTVYKASNPSVTFSITLAGGTIYTTLFRSSNGWAFIFASENPFTYSGSTANRSNLHGKDFYYGSYSNNYRPGNYDSANLPINTVTQSSNTLQGIDSQIAYVMLYGSVIHSGGGVDGIGTQDGATLPDTSTWDSVANTDSSLRSQYPSAYNDALQYDVLQPDGSVITKTYIPVALPDTDSLTSTNPWTDQQPTTSNQSQTTPTIDTDTATQTIIDTIIKTITQTQTLPDTDLDNPTDTGTGDTTPPVVPTGSASALWSVYHPTQAQVDQFGAWLWSDLGLDLDTLKKILNDPMNGIITLHKIFAPPVDSGSASIVVGRLDSGVSSATVNQQYVTVDCGSVELYEQFGNVFDYDPYTDVSLYLPFIGIVPLDTADVMRATIHVTYGVDVYTGACLAQVEVSRDACTVNMYQYAGLCSVEYPLTGAQHSGLISGLLGVGVGIATGNVPAVIGGAAAAMKVSKSRANGFSGNAGAMGIKKPYLIISRPQTKVAQTFPGLQGYPTNYSTRLGDCSGQVVVKAVHVEGIPATDQELKQIENLLMSGVLV